MEKTVISLELFTEEDFSRFRSWIKSERFMYQFAGPAFTYPLTRQQLSAYIAEKNRQIYKVIENSSNRVIGHGEINRIDTRNQSARLCRILIAEKGDRNKGYGQILINQLLHKAFAELKLHRVDLGVFKNNSSAISCYEKCGFRKEGLLRESFLIDKTFHSTINMSILKNEWKANA